MDDGLKPCPFCGGEAGVREKVWRIADDPGYGRPSYRVECGWCASAGTECWNEEAAVAAWNRRAERMCPECGARVVGE